MSRQNIFEILKQKYNTVKEANKILDLFDSELFHTNYNAFTIEKIFDDRFLFDWKHRGSYLSCEEIRKTLLIPNVFTNDTKMEDYIKTIEYMENLLHPIKANIEILRHQFYFANKNFYYLIQNIELLTENLMHQKVILEEENKILIVPKKAEAISVAEISTEKTALAILKYNHASMKGDLEGKRNLLNSIYRAYETLLKNPIEGYTDFYNKTRGLYNILDIRHDNRTKENNKNDTINITDEELEKWYDELYQLLLFCVLIKDNLKRKKEVDEFLKSIKNRTC